MKVPDWLLDGVERAESGGNPRAVSRAGAMGAYQFMPATAREYGIDPFDRGQSREAAARYLASLTQQMDGDVVRGLQAYNWGPGNMRAYLRTGLGAKGQPMPAETQQYPDRVLGAAKPKPAPQGKSLADELFADEQPPAGRSIADELFAEAPQAQPERPKPERSRLSEAARQIALTARAIATRNPVVALGSMAGDALGLDTSRTVQSLADRVFPSPESATERVVQDAAGGMMGAAGGVGAGRALAQAAGPVAQGVGRAMAAASGNQVAAGAASGAAGGAARESGADASGQLAASLLAGGVVGAASPRAGGTAAARANAQRDAAAAAARAEGYTVPPSQTNPSMLNRVLEGTAGKISTAQSASKANEAVTRRLAARALGLAPDDLSPEAIGRVRQQAGAVYEAVKAAGPLKPDADFARALSDVRASNAKLAQNFPGLVRDDVERLVDPILRRARTGAFDADATIEAVKQLRADAASNLANALDPGRKALGRAQLQTAGALEGMIERNLSAAGNPDLLPAFRAARTLYAKTFTVEKALNPQTGVVNARKIARELDKGRPLSGELRKIAEFGQAFPAAAQSLERSVLPISPLDVMGGGGLSLASGNPAVAGLALARPGIRAAILSQPYQRTLGTARYGQPAALTPALAQALSGVGLERQ